MPSITLGGVLVAIVVLVAVAILIGRATRSPGSVAHVLEEAARVNTARLAAPGRTSAGDITDPRAYVQNDTALRRSRS
jgi:hypothetical protein